MLEIGRELKQAREEQRLTLEELSTRTMIAKKYLSALEEGRFELFPGEVYLKGALRKYAGELRLDPEVLLGRYDQTQPAKTEEKKVAQPTVTQRPAVKVVRRTTKRINKRRLALFVMVIILFTAGVRTISNMVGKEPPPVAGPVHSEEPVVEQPVEELPVIAPEEPEPPVLRVARDDSTTAVAFLVFNAEALAAEISFTDKCWVRVDADGSRTLEATFLSGQSQTLTAARLISVRIGNPPAVKLKINGVEVELPPSRTPYTLTIKLED